MAEKKLVTPSPDPAAEMRSKLINRLAVAGGLVASLLAVLAFFDYLAAPPEEPEAPVFSQPVPVAPKKEVSQPVTQASNLPEPPAPEESAKPVAEPPPPEVSATPTLAEPAAAPAQGRPRSKGQAHKEVATETPGEFRVPGRSTASHSTPAPRPKLPETPTEMTSSPAMLPAERSGAEPLQPSARVVHVQPAPAVVPPNVQRLFSGFLLQAGVFTSQQRAEELHAKLTLSGVPSTLETRVQVGPFRTRQEAEAAQEKLRELGINTVLVPPKGGRH